MDWLLRLLKDNPILLFFVLAAVANLVGSVAKARQKAASRRPPQLPKTKDRAAWPDQPSRPEPRPQPRAAAPGPLARPNPAAPAKNTADEIAAEMRRILGLDVELEPVETVAREPIRREAVRRPIEPERPPTPVEPTTGQRMLPSQVDSHVGERLAARQGPRSGRVGAHERGWGSLGGRRVEGLGVGISGPVQSLVDLRDLKRVILGAEILGPPVALRPNDTRLI